MIESSYKPINGESPPETNQPSHRRLLERIRNIDRSFVVSKLFYFFFYTALGALFPFFSLYYKQLWLSPSEIGILLALRPAVKLICLPLWKKVTGKYSSTRAVYFISIFGWLIGYYGQTLVSPNDISCYINNTSLTSSRNLSNSALNASVVHLASNDLGNSKFDVLLFPGHKLKYNPFDNKKVDRRNSFSSLSKPFLKLSSSSQSNEQGGKVFKSQNQKLKLSAHKQLYNMDKPLDKNKHDKRRRQGSYSNDEETKKQLNRKETDFAASREDDESKNEGISYKIKLMPSSFNGLKSPKPAEDFRVRYNYWIIRALAVIIILTEIITTPTPMLADSAVILSLTDTDNDYGRQRLFGCLGLALSAALVAVWVSKTSHCLYTDTIDYIPCFNIFIIAIALTIVVSLFFKFETPERGEEVDYKLLEAVKIFKSPRYGFFLFTMFVLGFAHSLQIAFLFWFLQDIGGTPVLFALMILVYCVSEVVMYFLLEYIIKAIGAQRTLAIAIACYTARFLMYGSLKYPWLVIPMELVQGMTYGGVWTVAGMYIKAPEGATKTIQSILHGAYWGVGMATGALVSGFAIEAHGAQNQFLVMSLVMAILCVAHFFIFLIDKVEGLEEEARRQREESSAVNPPKTTKKGEENFIGAAAAPLVPCLLYGR